VLSARARAPGWVARKGHVVEKAHREGLFTPEGRAWTSRGQAHELHRPENGNRPGNGIASGVSVPLDMTGAVHLEAACGDDARRDRYFGIAQDSGKNVDWILMGKG
jgi:hypothetical protein